MKILFKISGAPQKPEIRHSNFKDHFADINKSMSWVSIEPTIRLATKLYVIPYIGDGLYDDIAGKYDTGAALSSNQADLLDKLQTIVAHYTIYHALPTKNAIISDMGVQETSGKEGTSSPVSQWRYKTLRNEVGSTADRLLDELLTWLDTLTGDTYFDTWRGYVSSRWTTNKFFRNIDQLSEYIDIGQSRRTYLALLPSLQAAEDIHVIPILCDTQADTFKGKIAGGGVTPIDAGAVRLVRKVLAYKCMADSLLTLNVSIDSGTVTIKTYSDGLDIRRSISAQSEINAIEAIRRRYSELGDTAKQDLVDYLYANKASFSDWTTSSCYVAERDSNKKMYTPLDRTGGIMF